MTKRYLTLVMSCLLAATFIGSSEAKKLENVYAGYHLTSATYPFGIDKELNKADRQGTAGNFDWLLAFYYGLRARGQEATVDNATDKDGTEDQPSGDYRELFVNHGEGGTGPAANIGPVASQATGALAATAPAPQEPIAIPSAGNPLPPVRDKLFTLQQDSVVYQPILTIPGSVSVTSAAKKKDPQKNSPAESTPLVTANSSQGNTPSVTTPLPQFATGKDKLKEEPKNDSSTGKNTPIASSSVASLDLAKPETAKQDKSHEPSWKSQDAGKGKPGLTDAAAEKGKPHTPQKRRPEEANHENLALSTEGFSQNIAPPVHEGGLQAQPPAPVPEPATVLLISAGLAGLAGGRLRSLAGKSRRKEITS